MCEVWEYETPIWIWLLLGVGSVFFFGMVGYLQHRINKKRREDK